MNLTLKKIPDGTSVWYADGDEEDFKCARCSKYIEKGYICENNHKMVLCEECQFMFQMYKCKHDKRGEHSHLKWEKTKNAD